MEDAIPFGMRPATYEKIRELILSTYNRIWDNWYADFPKAIKATVEVPISADSPGFSESKNLLVNPVSEGNFEDFDVWDVDGWPVWKIQLVHEMLHEWQFKKPCCPSAEAIDLYARLGATFDGPGHGPDFFQAILEKAPYFGMRPEELSKKI